jgi:hypothetical protein
LPNISGRRGTQKGTESALRPGNSRRQMYLNEAVSAVRPSASAGCSRAALVHGGFPAALGAGRAQGSLAIQALDHPIGRAMVIVPRGEGRDDNARVNKRHPRIRSSACRTKCPVLRNCERGRPATYRTGAGIRSGDLNVAKHLPEFIAQLSTYSQSSGVRPSISIAPTRQNQFKSS